MENNVNTRWTHATTNPSEAIAALVSCIEYGKDAWIEVRKNGDQAFPIMRTNPQLDNPFNWKMMYGTVRNEEEMQKHQYLNAMEKELTYNWTAGFGDKEAVEHYKETGEITEGLLSGVGVPFPIRIKDAEEYREKITGDNYKYRFFVTYWEPEKDIKPYVVDDRIDEVFVICCYDKDSKEPVDKKAAIRRAGEFLLQYADRLEA